MKEEKTNIFKASLSDLLPQETEKTNTPKDGIDCNKKKSSQKQKYASFNLSESILFNTK